MIDLHTSILPFKWPYNSIFAFLFYWFLSIYHIRNSTFLFILPKLKLHMCIILDTTCLSLISGNDMERPSKVWNLFVTFRFHDRNKCISKLIKAMIDVRTSIFILNQYFLSVIDSWWYLILWYSLNSKCWKIDLCVVRTRSLNSSKVYLCSIFCEYLTWGNRFAMLKIQAFKCFPFSNFSAICMDVIFCKFSLSFF